MIKRGSEIYILNVVQLKSTDGGIERGLHHGYRQLLPLDSNVESTKCCGAKLFQNLICSSTVCFKLVK